jgi:hypothetical protein
MYSVLSFSVEVLGCDGILLLFAKKALHLDEDELFNDSDDSKRFSVIFDESLSIAWYVPLALVERSNLG